MQATVTIQTLRPHPFRGRDACVIWVPSQNLNECQCLVCLTLLENKLTFYVIETFLHFILIIFMGGFPDFFAFCLI